jgi:hypothetical protein
MAIWQLSPARAPITAGGGERAPRSPVDQIGSLSSR